MTTRSSTLYVSTVAVVGVGFALQMFLWSRQWIYGDQYALLTPAVEYLASGELAPFSKSMSGGGRIPGTLLQLVIATPLRLWSDFRAPALAMGLSQVAALGILLWVGASAHGRRFAPAFAAVYWLSPWRLYHAGFLWEPGFLLLPAALHLGCCWLLRHPAGDQEPDTPATTPAMTMAASFGLGATLLATLQIHASFLVLALASAILMWRRLIRPRLTGLAAGVVAGGLTLVPTAIAFATGDLPRIAPNIDDRVALPLLVISNAGKAISYWFRMGSADIGRRLRQTAWLDTTPAGTEAPVALPSLLVSAVVLLSVVSVVIAVYANWRYLHREDSMPPRDPSDPGAPEVLDTWLQGYTLVMLVALAAAGTLSPVPVQGWHVLIALHAACIPTAFWLLRSVDTGGRARALGIAFVALLIVTSVLVGLGHPTYLRPDEIHVQQQNIPELLRPLIPPA